MTVLITGAGLVGTLAAKRLVERGERPVLYEVAPQMDNIRRHIDPSTVDLVRGDILDLPDLLRTVRDEKIDRIIHTAGLLTAGARERPYTAGKVNLLGTMNILETARLTDAKRVVFCSSATVYMRTFATGATEPFSEDFTMKALSGRPPGVYAALKLTSEWLGLDYCDLYGVDFVTTRFAGVFGPWKGVPGGLPGRLMSALVENVALGRPAYVDDPVLTWGG
ncbi:MAG: NAD-dependent epimerase/dehydratase family protein, partial [Dehalococcoidia bacterium]|nr:NAD-dependent epimerase/dehydratase family protein [Dehalococcoidia bacterium]